MKVITAGGIFLAYVIAGDIVGVVASFVADVLPFRAISTPLFFTIWFVVGVFCGLLSFDKMGAVLTGKSDVDWSQLPSSRRTGWIVSGIALLITCLLGFLCYRLFWTQGGSSEFFVPDNIPLSITFFSAIILSTVGAHFMFSPSDAKKPG